MTEVAISKAIKLFIHPPTVCKNCLLLAVISTGRFKAAGCYAVEEKGGDETTDTDGLYVE